ncbi:alkaline phosphatase [Ferruginibacter sp.]
MKHCLVLLLLLMCCTVGAQTSHYTTANAHSHNDYENKFPFQTAYSEDFGSMEADIFLWHDSLIVGHTENDIQYRRTLENLYLDPLLKKVTENNNQVYKDTALQLQLLVDIKTEAVATLDKLVTVLNKYPALTALKKLHFVITGNRPEPASWSRYPSFILFDGELQKEYSAAALDRIPLFSANLKSYTNWNGKGILAEPDAAVIDSIIAQVHAKHKKIRFWNAPDFTNAWYQLMNAGVDYINTDHITELSVFFSQLSLNSYTSPQQYQCYQPTYKTDGSNKKVKNIILLIGDGCSLPQLYAAYTANHAQLNIFNIKNTGLSKTSSYDNYITDSAPGATSIASGQKTNNRSVGVDHTGKALPLIPVYLQKRKIKTGLVTCGDITDATPADFYAHQKERDSSIAVLRDLKDAPITILMGSGNESLANVKLLNDDGRQYISAPLLNELQPKFTVVNTIGSVTDDTTKKWVVIEKQAGLSILNGRGNWLQHAFLKTLSILSKNKDGFFIMTEGAQIDYGGHANNLPYVVSEATDFDKVVGEALRFADKDGETLVIVTADHETGGLTLLAGDYSKGYVSGKFSTNDHTALPVPVFAYGPMSHNFTGVYENTELFYKIMAALGIPAK